MGSFSGKVCVVYNFRYMAFSHGTLFIGLAHSSLPTLVQAHTKHLLTYPAYGRQAIQLLPHQLIASKQVREALLSLLMGQY